MPTLRVVPDPPGEPGEAPEPPEPADPPDELGLTATTDLPGAAVPAGDAGPDLPVSWFDCTDPTVGASVRAHVLTVMNLFGVDTDAIADAMVLVSELVTNVRDHTVSDRLGVRVRATPERVVVAVIERAATGAPADGRLRPGPFATPADRVLSDRGRGLLLLDSMASEWGFVRRERVTTTWFALAVHRSGASGHVPEIRRF